MSRTNRAANGATTALLQFGVQIALQIVISPLVLRTAGLETLGVYAILGQAIGFLALLDMGFSVAISRFLARSHDGCDQGVQFRNVLTIGKTFILFTNLTYALILWVLSYWISNFFQFEGELAEQTKICLQILSIWSILRSPFLIYNIALIATQNQAKANLIGMIGNIGRLISSVALLVSGYGLISLILANVISEAITISLGTLYFKRTYSQLTSGFGFPDWSLFIEMRSFGLQALVINFATLLILTSDNLIVGYIFSAAAVSIYYTTQMPALIGQQIIIKIAASAMPAINELYAKNEYVKLRKIYLKLQRYVILLACFFMGGFILLHERLIGLWVGDSLYAGFIMTVSLTIFVFLITTSFVNNMFVMAKGDIKSLGRLAVVEGVLNVGLSFLFGNFIGLGGIMVATVTANSVSSVYLCWRAAKDLQISLLLVIKLIFSRQIFHAGVALIICEMVALILPSHNMENFAALFVLYSSIYLILIYKFFITNEEKESGIKYLYQLKNIIKSINLKCQL